MIESAWRDAVVFDKLVNDAQVHDSMLGFHAQQAIEKSLKAALFARAVPVPRTHDISVLLDAIAAEAGMILPPHSNRLDELKPFAVQGRYGALDVGALDRAAAGLWMHDVLRRAESASA